MRASYFLPFAGASGGQEDKYEKRGTSYLPITRKKVVFRYFVVTPVHISHTFDLTQSQTQSENTRKDMESMISRNMEPLATKNFVSSCYKPSDPLTTADTAEHSQSSPHSNPAPDSKTTATRDLHDVF